MTALTLHKSSKKQGALSNAHLTFNRHRLKIEQLRSQLESVKQECDKALLLYHSDLQPKEMELGAIIIEFINKLRDITQDPKSLSKKEREVLNGMIKDCLGELFSFRHDKDVPESIKELYAQYHGRSRQDIFNDEISKLKEMLEKSTGISDIDMPDLSINESFEEILQKIVNPLIEKTAEAQNNLPLKKKSKRELLKEKKAKDLEILQNKSLNNIYKRLVKELHPDIEQDPDKRSDKDKLMRRVTTAYENEDLVSLLALESEWLGHLEGTEALNDENLKIYNLMLKDQIEDLKFELKSVVLHSRYFEIQRFISYSNEEPIEGIYEGIRECESITNEYAVKLQDISGKNPLKFLRVVLQEMGNFDEQIANSSPEDLFSLLDILRSEDEFATFNFPKKVKNKRKK